MTKGDFQLALVHWVSPIDDPIYTLNAFKAADIELNFSQWENSDFRFLLDESEKEVNPFQRSVLLSQAEEILSREVPIIPLCYHPSQALIGKKLQFTHRALCDSFCLARSFYKKEV